MTLQGNALKLAALKLGETRAGKVVWLLIRWERERVGRNRKNCFKCTNLLTMSTERTNQRGRRGGEEQSDCRPGIRQIIGAAVRNVLDGLGLANMRVKV